MAPRNRKPGNEWMDVYPGLSVRHDGVYQLRHPVTGKYVGLKTKDRTIAVKAWQAFMPGWRSEKDQQKTDTLLARLNNMEEVAKKGVETSLKDFAQRWRQEQLPQQRAKGKQGKLLGDRTRQDYESICKKRIEVAACNFPLADTYADIKLKQYLAENWGNKNTTYNHTRTVLSIIYNWAYELGYVRDNPVLKIPKKEQYGRFVYLDDASYAAITGKMFTHEYYGEIHDGEWSARICDLALFSACRPADVTKIEDGWFDQNGVLSFRAAKNQKLMEIEDATGALAETVLWLREFKRKQGKISKYLCVYPKYMGKRMYKQERVSTVVISRMWSAASVDLGFKEIGEDGKVCSQFQFKDIRKKSTADDPGQNKGGHSARMQEYYEKVRERAHRAHNNLTNPRRLS